MSERGCSVSGCNGRHRARGMCAAHYNDCRSRGALPATRGGRAQRYLQAVVQAWRNSPEAGCIEWPFTKMPDGYGQAWFNGKVTLAHRASLHLSAGPPDNGALQAAHACHNPTCINPAHLRWATPAENIADSVALGRQAQGTRKASSKLTEESVAVARARRGSGAKTSDLAAEYGVGRETMRLALAGSTWRHV